MIIISSSGAETGRVFTWGEFRTISFPGLIHTSTGSTHHITLPFSFLRSSFCNRTWNGRPTGERESKERENTLPDQEIPGTQDSLRCSGRDPCCSCGCREWSTLHLGWARSWSERPEDARCTVGSSHREIDRKSESEGRRVREYSHSRALWYEHVVHPLFLSSRAMSPWELFFFFRFSFLCLCFLYSRSRNRVRCG